MADSKKYYWLKLKRDFFKRHDIRIIEEMPNGKDYILFYLKLLLESIDHDGTLRFSETIPYNEQMLSVVTNTNIDIVRSAMKIFTELNMMDVLDDGTLFMSEVDKMIGSETEWARKKRLYREQQSLLGDGTSEGQKKTMSDKSKSIEKELDKEKESELDVAVATGNTDTDLSTDEGNSFKYIGGKLGKGVVLLTDAQMEELLEKLGLNAFDHYVEKLATFIIDKDAKVSNHYATILKWAKEDARI